MTTTKLEPLPLQLEQDALGWLRGRTIEDLKAIELEEPDSPIPVLLFPEPLRYRNGKGEQKEFATLLKVPRDDDHVSGTIAAVAWVAKKYSEPSCRTPARARELLGSEGYYSHIERCATLCICLRNPKNPAMPMFMLDIFVKTFETPTIKDIWERAETLSRIFDPRLGSITLVQFWQLAREVARVKNASPLFALGPASLNDWITIAGAELVRFQTLSSSSSSSSGSTPA